MGIRSTREGATTTCGPHRRKGYVVKLSQWSGTQASFNSRSFEDTRPEAKAAVDEEWENQRQYQHGTQGRVRSKSAVIRQAKKDGKHSSLREFDGPLSLEGRRTCKTPPEIQGASCAPGGQRQRRRRMQSSIHRARCFSVSDGSSKVLGHYLQASWYGWRNK